MEPESPPNGLVGSAVGEAEERGGEEKMGVGSVGERRGERLEEKVEGGFGHAEGFGPLSGIR